MKKLAMVLGAAAASLVCLSCAGSNAPTPEGEATKIRVHRIAPSEDIEESPTMKGSPVPPTSQGSWKF